jgi:hypothetical protein
MRGAFSNRRPLRKTLRDFPEIDRNVPAARWKGLSNGAGHAHANCISCMRSAQSLTVDQNAMDLNPFRKLHQELGVAAQMMDLGRLTFGERRHRFQIAPV